MKTLMPHQEKALKYAIQRERIALYMEMRLGKTLVAIRWLKHNKHKCALVLAPKPTHPSWLAELKEEGIKGLKPEGSLESRFKQAEQYLHDHQKLFLLLNYEAVTKYPDFLALPYGVIICDESTYIRKPTTGISKLLCKHTDHIQYKALLSGQPAPESPKDYFMQFKFLHGSFMHEHVFWHWQSKFCQQIGFGWDVRPSKVPMIKEEVHELAFVLSRKDAGVGGKKIYERRYVDMNTEQKKFMKQIAKDYEYEIDGKFVSAKHAPVKYLWLGRIAGGYTPKGEKMISNAKVWEIIELLDGELSDQVVIIWFRFNHELKEVYTALKDLGVKVGIFTAQDKKGVNPDGTLSSKIRVMCAQSKCGKMGMPWYASSTMIFYSNHYDQEVRAQCEDRGISPLTKEPYLIIDLLAEGSIDEDALDLLKEKKMSAKYFMSRLDEKWLSRRNK